MTHRSLRAVLLAPCLLAACGGQRGEPAFAVPHGSVQVEEDGSLSGYQVWELFSRKWRKKQDPDTHICAVVIELDGIAEEPSCASCEAAWLLSAERLETDCSGLGADFGEPAAFGFGDVPAKLQETAPAGSTHGWYVSWDTAAWEPVGYAWSEGETAEWSAGESWSLDAGLVWELDP